MLCPCPRVANACTHVCVSYDLVVSSPFVYWLGIATGTCVFYDIHAHTRWEEIMAHTFIDICVYPLKQLFFFSSTLCWMSKISWPLQVEKKPPLEIISTFSKGITLTPTHSSGLWILMANCLAEGSSLKSLWLDGFEKLFSLRNVTNLYIYVYIYIYIYMYRYG